MITARFTLNTSLCEEALRDLKLYADRLPEGVAQRLLDTPNFFFQQRSVKSNAAEGTIEIFLEPTDGCRELLAAMRAGRVDRSVVEHAIELTR